MAAADYALCDSCGGKVFYDADTDIPAGTVVMHPDCAVKELAAERRRGYEQAITHLRDDEAFVAWMIAQPPGTSFKNDNQIGAAYLSARLTEETTP